MSVFGRYQVGASLDADGLPWPVLDTHFGNEVVAVCRSHCLAREMARTLNEPVFRPPPPNARPKKPAEGEA